MAQTNFNVGAIANDGTGEPLRQAFQEQQAMNTELYTTKVDKVTGKQLSSNNYTDAEVIKLDGIEVGAEVNVQANLLEDDNTNDSYIIGKEILLKTFIKSNENLAIAQRKDDTLYGILDQYTGEEITLEKTTDANYADNIIYFDLGGEKFKRVITNFVDVRWFGASESKEDNLIEIQEAIDYCLINYISSLSLGSITYNINGTLSIPRETDALNTSQKFYIKNGGIKQIGNTAIIRGDLTDNISSQLVTFQNVEFSSTSLTATVLYKNTMLRMFFESCSFVKIKFCNTIEYLQSIYFNDCNFRYWSGDFFLAKNGCYDIHFKGGLAEHGENFINVNPTIEGFTRTERINGLFVSDMCIEGMVGVGILYADSNLISIQNNYFEANIGGDILHSSNDLQNTTYNVNINNNILLLGGAEPIPNAPDGEYYHVIYNSTQGGTCQGNFSTGNFSYQKSDYFTIDFRGNYAQNGIITNKENCIGNIKTYYGNNLSPETLNYDVLILKGAVVFVRDFNPTTSNIIGWICITSGTYLTAIWKEIYNYTPNQVILTTTNQTKDGSLGVKGLLTSGDSIGAVQTQLVFQGLTNPNLKLYAGINTSTEKITFQGLEDGAGTLPIVLQPLGGKIEIPDAIDNNNPIALGQLTVVNTTTTDLSLATLNSTYPTAFPGFEVHCMDIIVGGTTIYKKTATGWVDLRVIKVV